MNKFFKLVARFLSSPDAGWKVATFFLVAFSLILLWGATVLETSVKVQRSKVQLLERLHDRDRVRITRLIGENWGLVQRAKRAENTRDRMGANLDMMPK